MLIFLGHTPKESLNYQEMHLRLAQGHFSSA